MKKSFLITIVILSTLLLCSSIFYYINLITKVDVLKDHFPIFNLKENQYELTNKKPAHWVEIESIPKIAKWAIIVSEDWAFYDHEGIDVNQIQVVVEESLEEGEFVRGASTITQQVVKNVFLSNERTLIRKLKEVILASSLEKKFSKDEILEFYFNLVELGDGIYGIKAASELYFQKHPKDLNGKEGAFLAMLLPSPKKYAQSFRQEGLTAFASEQIDNILIKLRQAKIINEDKRLELKSLPLSFEVINFIDEDLLSVENESYEAEENSQENDLLSR